MEPRRSPMALRPPQEPVSNINTTNGANMSSTSSPSHISSSSRPRTLKRTISKCGIDAACSVSDLTAIAPKKLAPLQEPSFSRTTYQQHQQQHQQQYELTVRQQQQLQFYQQQQQQQRQQLLQEEQTANGMYVDDGEPVLLPRYSAYGRPDDDEFPGYAHEYSPVAPFGWDGTPQGAKDRYYESILESTTAFVSPSPQHVMYAYTPNGGVPSTNSTVSFGSSSSNSPFTPRGETSVNNYKHFQATPSSTVATAHVPHRAMQDLEYLNAANLHAIMINYLEEMFQYYDLAKSFTFAGVGEMVQSVPFAFRYIQGLVKNRLGISWHLVGSFVENILDFIGDEDIREANIKEFADFLRSIQDQLYENMPPGNIFLNLYEFFQNVLAKFKKFLIQRWIELQRIQFPCEFGKKSETLFLCMECHREHL